MATLSATPGFFLSGIFNSPACSPEIAGARAGEEPAFRALFEMHGSRIYSFSLRLTGEIRDAEQLTRDIFLEAFSRIGTIVDDTAFAAELTHCAARKMPLRHRRPAQNASAGQRPAMIRHLSLPEVEP